MATASTTPRKRTASKATAAKAAPAPASDSQESVDENGLVKEVYALDNRGRTRNGEGNETYWNLHQAGGARGQIFTDPSVVEVKVLIVRNPNATA
jgi:hypothetical protein